MSIPGEFELPITTVPERMGRADRNGALGALGAAGAFGNHERGDELDQRLPPAHTDKISAGTEYVIDPKKKAKKAKKDKRYQPPKVSIESSADPADIVPLEDIYETLNGPEFKGLRVISDESEDSKIRAAVSSILDADELVTDYRTSVFAALHYGVYPPGLQKRNRYLRRSDKIESLVEVIEHLIPEDESHRGATISTVADLVGAPRDEVRTVLFSFVSHFQTEREALKIAAEALKTR